MTPHIPLARPDISALEEAEVLEVLRSGQLSLGPKLPEFERLLSSYVAAPWGAGVSSGTAGLHLVTRSLGIGEGDCVPMSSFSFISAANAARYEGAEPVFLDIDEDTLNLSPAAVGEYLSGCERRDGALHDPRTGRRVAAIMSTDIFGHPADLPALSALAAAHDIPLISDSCEALGSRYRCADGDWVHAGHDAAAAIFAFYPNKQIATGEGGMVTGADAHLHEQMTSLRNQGRAPQDPWLRHTELGYNYRMDELSAALGVAQMTRIDEILGKRAQVADWYAERLHDVEGVTPPTAATWAAPAWFVEFLRVDDALDRDKLVAHLSANGVSSKAYFDIPVHRQPPYADQSPLTPMPLVQTDRAASQIMIVPMFATMTQSQVDQACAVLAAAVKAGA